MMSSNLGILILFLIATPFGSTEEIVSRAIPKQVMDEFIVAVNQKRRAFAEEHSLANMHELTWSQKLADQLMVDVSKNNTKDTYGRNTVTSHDFNDILSDIDNVMDKIRVDLKNGTKNVYYRDEFYFLLRLHRRIGCSEWSTNFEAYSFKSCYMEPGALIGFKQTKKGWNELQEILEMQGTPGELCYDEYVNNNGLCALLPTSTFAPINDAPTTKLQPTRRPVSIPEKDSVESVDVTESGHSSASSLVSFHSVLLCSFLVQIGTII